MGKIKVALIGVMLLVVMVATSGCAMLMDEFTNVKSSFSGIPMVIQTYDYDANIIDRVEGTSIDITPNAKFSTVNIDGETIEKSSVLNITVGGQEMGHVGSSMIAYDKSLVDILDVYAKNVDIKNTDRSVPFVNKMVNSVRNDWTGKETVLLIRTQTGKPLATFVGNDVRVDSTSIDKSTSFLIDGKRLLVYRCDYTYYTTGMLK